MMLVGTVLVTHLLISLLLTISLLITAFLPAIILLPITLFLHWTSKQSLVDAVSKVSEQHFIEQFRE